MSLPQIKQNDLLVFLNNQVTVNLQVGQLTTLIIEKSGLGDEDTLAKAQELFQSNESQLELFKKIVKELNEEWSKSGS